MSKHLATIHWQRQAVGEGYSRNHTWTVDAGLEIPAAAALSVVPAPYSEAGRLDPEAAFVGSLASCHMLWFLSIAEARGFKTASYTDEAVGVLGKGEDGKMRITKVDLKPVTRFEGQMPSPSELSAMHDEVHARCFIANSVNSTINIHPAFESPDD